MSQDSDRSQDEINNFLYPKSHYHGDFSPNNPNNLLFNANLQEFAQKVSYVCGLESNGKISTAESYDRIKQLWRELKASKKELLDQDDAE
ncbi:MAG: hypothetical protein AAFR77_12700 [Cyanobacteria bacterium J06631_2]